VTDERITITGGASQNLACLLQVFSDPLFTRNVWIVSPAYMLAFRIFQDSALKLRAVPEDNEGIDIDFLRREIKKSEEKAVAEKNDELVSAVDFEIHKTYWDPTLPREAPSPLLPCSNLTGSRHMKCLAAADGVRRQVVVVLPIIGST
jgi:hypothetical protein